MVGVANQKNCVSIFISGVEDRQYLAEKYVHKLGKVKAKISRVMVKKLEDLKRRCLGEVVSLCVRSFGGVGFWR